MKSLDEVVLLVGAVGGVALVRKIGDRPGSVAGNDIEEDDGQRPDVGFAGGV
jgi:hypothetical protein